MTRNVEFLQQLGFSTNNRNEETSDNDKHKKSHRSTTL